MRALSRAIVLGIGILMVCGSPVRAQFGDMGEAVKKGASDAAKGQVMKELGMETPTAVAATPAAATTPAGVTPAAAGTPATTPAGEAQVTPAAADTPAAGADTGAAATPAAAAEAAGAAPTPGGAGTLEDATEQMKKKIPKPY